MSAKNTKKFSRRATVDEKDLAQFEQLGAKWWDESGPMKPLHRLNPVRLDYIRRKACAHFGLDAEKLGALDGLTAADIGCGGGIVAEPLCRMGAAVTGIDAGAENIRAARVHAEASGLEIDYRVTTAEELAESGAQFDIVTALEVVEHVADTDLFLSSCAELVRPGGLLVVSTLNRTAKSFVLGIGMAEYVLRWLPTGTHDWHKFMKPSEVAAPLMTAGLDVTDVTGLIYDPLRLKFRLSDNDLDVNYLMTAVKGIAV
jgi:2-polyprenyl-6-hydroxyphenyl methylase/3-demethylubiquinone-9 3-methyltransferase